MQGSSGNRKGSPAPVGKTHFHQSISSFICGTAFQLSIHNYNIIQKKNK